MAEHRIVKELLRELRTDFPTAVIFKHSERMVSGVPDISVTWKRRTIWIEVKHANPSIIETGLQHLYNTRLAAAAETMIYVIYDDVTEHTYIVPPSGVATFRQSRIKASGFDHSLVSAFIRGIQS